MLLMLCDIQYTFDRPSVGCEFYKKMRLAIVPLSGTCKKMHVILVYGVQHILMLSIDFN